MTSTAAAFENKPRCLIEFVRTHTTKPPGGAIHQRSTSSSLGGRVPEKPHEEFKAGARHLRQLADLLMSQYVPDKQMIHPGSPADIEQNDHRYDSAWGRATHEVVHQSGAHVHVVFDHMHAMSAVTLSPNTVLALSTLSRTVLESLGTLNYLYEPGIPTLERVRRRYNIRLASLVEQQNILFGLAESDPRKHSEMMQDAEGPVRSILAIKSSGARHGLIMATAKVRGNVRPPRWLGTRPPRDQRLITDLLSSSGNTDTRLGPALHRITSATAHGQPHGSLLFMLGHSASATDPGVANVEMGLSLNHFSTILGAVFVGFQNATARLVNYYGWPPHPWANAIGEVSTTFNRWLAIERTQT